MEGEQPGTPPMGKFLATEVDQAESEIYVFSPEHEHEAPSSTKFSVVRGLFKNKPCVGLVLLSVGLLAGALFAARPIAVQPLYARVEAVQALNEGFVITALAPSLAGSTVVSSKMPGSRSKYKYTQTDSWNSMQEWIEHWKHQKSGGHHYKLVSLKSIRGSGHWAAIMMAVSGLSDTKVTWHSRLSGKELLFTADICGQPGMKILDVTHANGYANGWAFVCGRTDEVQLQHLFWTTTWDQLEGIIQQKHRQGYDVTALEKGTNDASPCYVVVMAKVPTFGNQLYIHASKEQLSSKIYENDPKRLHQMTAVLDTGSGDSDSRFFVVMTQVTRSTIFPKSDTKLPNNIHPHAFGVWRGRVVG